MSVTNETAFLEESGSGRPATRPHQPVTQRHPWPPRYDEEDYAAILKEMKEMESG